MTEEKLKALRQADHSLRDALRMDEVELPQMPSDLNARLMQRVADEQPRKTTVRRLWPWVAAACVAGVMMIWLTPPKETPTDVVAVKTVTEQPAVNNKVEEPKTAKAETEVTLTAVAPEKAKRGRTQLPAAAQAETLQPEVVTAVVEEPKTELAQASTPKVKMQTLTEHDIPITRPENYKHTPEELAQLRKQADEAYLKWVELELEISKNNLQQTAQQE